MLISLHTVIHTYLCVLLNRIKYSISSHLIHCTGERANMWVVRYPTISSTICIQSCCFARSYIKGFKDFNASLLLFSSGHRRHHRMICVAACAFLISYDLLSLSVFQLFFIFYCFQIPKRPFKSARIQQTMQVPNNPGHTVRCQILYDTIYLEDTTSAWLHSE